MKNCAKFRFYEELNDFLPKEKKKIPFDYHFEGNPSIKHVIESIGVPHTEIDLLLVNGESVDLAYKLHCGDSVSVFPVFESFDISKVSKVRIKPLREPRFIADVHLGKLVKYLRILGFDTLYRNDYSDEDIVTIIKCEKRRILLTRDRGLLKRKIITHGYWIRTTDSRKQLHEVIARFDLLSLIRPFTVCMVCNGKVSNIKKDKIFHNLPVMIRKSHDEFNMCSVCKRLYWQGSHYDKMQRFINQIIREFEVCG